MAEDKTQSNPSQDPAQEISILKNQIESLKSRIEAIENGLEEFYENALIRIEKLESTGENSVDIQAEPKAKAVKLPTCPEFTLDKKRYKFLVPAFIMEGTRYVAEEIKEKETLEKIVKEYPGIIQAL